MTHPTTPAPKKGYLFDILEPHDSSRNDNAVEAVGLAEFAEKHPYLFDRIQLIRKQRGADGNEKYYRLDMAKNSVSQKVRGAITDTQLDQIFEQEATIKP